MSNQTLQIIVQELREEVVKLKEHSHLPPDFAPRFEELERRISLLESELKDHKEESNG